MSSYSAVDQLNPGCTVLCRVKKYISCHDIEAYEEPLMHGQQGSILHLPCNTGGLQGISQKSLQHHITGFSCMHLQLLPMSGYACYSCHRLIVPLVLQSRFYGMLVKHRLQTRSI